MSLIRGVTERSEMARFDWSGPKFTPKCPDQSWRIEMKHQWKCLSAPATAILMSQNGAVQETLAQLGRLPILNSANIVSPTDGDLISIDVSYTIKNYGEDEPPSKPKFTATAVYQKDSWRLLNQSTPQCIPDSQKFSVLSPTKLHRIIGIQNGEETLLQVIRFLLAQSWTDMERRPAGQSDPRQR